ncbi:hypothetical protein N5V81_12005 [Escherichia coli]|nr:hypothetical protein [Escherichia coli]
MNATAAQTKSLEWLNRLRANPKIPLIVAGSAAVAVMVALILWAKAPDYRTLFSNLSDQDGGAIVSQLTQMNIPLPLQAKPAALLKFRQIKFTNRVCAWHNKVCPKAARSVSNYSIRKSLVSASSANR